MFNFTDEHVITNDNPSYNIPTVSGIDNIHNVLIISLNDDKCLTSQMNMWLLMTIPLIIYTQHQVNTRLF